MNQSTHSPSISIIRPVSTLHFHKSREVFKQTIVHLKVKLRILFEHPFSCGGQS